MAIADFCVGITSIMNGQLHYFYYQGQVSLVVYKVGSFIPYAGSCFISVSSLAIMTADRLISVMFPVRYRIVMTKRKIICMIVASWLITTVLIVNQGILFFAYDDDGKTELKSRGIMLVIGFSIAFSVLLTGNLYLYTKVRNKKRSSQNGQNQTGKSSKTNKICICLTIVFLICWLPLVIYYVVWSFVSHIPFASGFFIISLCLASANSIANPFVYIIQRKCYHSCFRKILSGM